MNTSANWYAVYTKSRYEKRVTELLKRKGVDVYCPLNRVLRQWHDRKKWVEEPLFNSYVFVRIASTEQIKVKETEGVLNFVHWLGRPAVIHNEEICTIKEFISNHSNVQLEKTVLNVHDQVQITSGPFIDIRGNIVEVRRKVVRIQLLSLGYNLVATIETDKVRVIPA